MIDKNLASPCGLYCAACEFYQKQCPGCGSIKGKPFWTAHMNIEICPLYDCCMNQKQLEHCGLCDSLPCETFSNFHDPALSPEEAKKSVLDRKSGLLRRKEIGTGRWIQEKKSKN